MDNLVFNDSVSEEAVIDSVRLFASNGGGCLVENSSEGFHRKTSFMKRITQETGVHVVQGTGNANC